MFKCILCANQKSKTLKVFKNVPSNISKLLKEQDLKKDKKTTVKLVSCMQCGLVQLQNNILQNDESYYDDYVMAVTHSPFMRDHQNNQLNKLVSEYSLVKTNNILEVGSGDGHYANLLYQRGFATTGVEPSISFYKHAIKTYKGPKFVHDYLTKDTSLRKNHYHGWVARQVFEHLMNPNEILQALKLFIKDDAVGLIEIPSFEQTVKLNRYYDIFPDHVVYYTKETLAMLLIRNGYIVEEIVREANGEYLSAYFRNGSAQKAQISNFIDSYSSYVDSLTKTVVTLAKEYSRIGAWGAGGRGNTFYSIMNLDKSLIAYVIDSDPNKQGKYTVGSHLPIVEPSSKNINDLEVIVLTAVMYQKEVLDVLKKFKYKGKVLLVAPEPKLIDLNEKT